MMPHLTPMGGCCGFIQIAGLKYCGHIREVHVHQFRMDVAAVTLISHPIVLQIALFKHMNPYAKVAGPVDRMGVDWPCITVKNDVFDGFLAHKRFKGLWPLAQGVAIAAVAVGPRPKDAITGVKADAPDFGPALVNILPKGLKNGPCGPCRNINTCLTGGILLTS